MKIEWTLNSTVSVQNLHYFVDYIVRTVRNYLLRKLHDFQSWYYVIFFFLIGFYCKLRHTAVKYVEPECLYLLIESVWHRLFSVIPQWSSYPSVLQFYSKRIPWDKKLLYSADHLLNLPVRFLLMLTTRVSINVIYCGKCIMRSVLLCNETIKERTTISDGNNFWLLLAWGRIGKGDLEVKSSWSY